MDRFRFTVGCLVFALTLAVVASPARAQSEAACASDLLVEAGETLSTIAARTLGDALAYDALAEATNAKAAVDASYATIDDINLIEIGWKLCVPAISEGAAAVAGPAEVAVTAPASPAEATLQPTPVQTTVPVVENEAFPYFDPDGLRIENMRQRDYPGSPIQIEQTLEPGVNYDRYIASYLSEGHKIYALLTVPQGASPATGWPIIVFNHGYIPPEQYRTTERYVAYVDGFARNGYIVFRSDYRGHGFSEGDATSAYGTPDYTVDVLNAVASIARYPAADADRIGMWGHSMGGQIALRSMVVTETIKAGVIWAGVVAPYEDIVYNWHRDGQYPIPASIGERALRWRGVLEAIFGTPQSNPAFWAEISPNSYVADLSGPIQLHHGTADASVPPDFSTALHDQAIAARKIAELYFYDGDNHNLSLNFDTAMARSIAFFDAVLK